MKRSRVVAVALAAVCATGLGLHGQQISVADAELQYQLASLLIEETRYQEALEAYERAAGTTDPALAIRARKGHVKTALRLAEFDLALEVGERLAADAPSDAEAITLHGDAMWSTGLFDESEALYRKAFAISPDSSRAQYGIARSLSTRNRLDEALEVALKAAALAPRDGEIYASIGEIYERLHRFDEAANAYTNYINLLPNKDRSDKAAWSRAQVRFLEAFEGRVPVQVDELDNRTRHTVPFRLVRDKVIVQGRVNGGSPQDFVLDTGSEETVLSAATARRAGVRPITYTLSAGVGEVGLRGLQLARADVLEIGTLAVRNLPVLIKNPALRGIPTREGESFSPLSLGLSMTIDYQQRLLTIGRDLPDDRTDIRLPMRVHRLAMVRGMLNSTRPAYFVVDTGGEVISISAETANSLEPSPFRRIPLRVYGTSGWDRDAFLMPGVDLDFDQITYRNFPLVVLNLRAPSVLLGFQVGGIVGHKFLAPYRVTMDMMRSELRLSKS
ncbi:MAG: tetratricopeptide repeat protein [Acidimicrobiia bacterium]|nr:tetratricopeptide repeat protein [Acidimicrobiia bacterium]